MPPAGRQTPAPVATPESYTAELGLPLLQVPHECQANHDHAHNHAINNEDFQAIGLEISNEPSNGSISNNRRNQDSHDKWHVHSRRQTFFPKFVAFKERGTCDDWSGKQETEAHRSLPRHVPEQARCYG